MGTGCERLSPESIPPHEGDVGALSGFEFRLANLSDMAKVINVDVGNLRLRPRGAGAKPILRGQKARARQAMNMGPLSVAILAQVHVFLLKCVPLAWRVDLGVDPCGRPPRSRPP